MGLTTLTNVTTNIDLDGDDDIIDFSRITDTSLYFNLENVYFQIYKVNNLHLMAMKI